MVDSLLHDWYPSAEPEVWVTCSACGYPCFSYQQCCESMLLPRSVSGILHCKTADSQLHVRDVAPDLALTDIAESFLLNLEDVTFKYVDIKKRKLLGEGAYGSVYEGMLHCRGRMSVKVAVKEFHDNGDLSPLTASEHSQLLHEIWSLR